MISRRMKIRMELYETSHQRWHLQPRGLQVPGPCPPDMSLWAAAKGPKQSRASSTIGLWPASTKYLAQERPHDDRLHLYILAFTIISTNRNTITTTITHLFHLLRCICQYYFIILPSCTELKIHRSLQVTAPPRSPRTLPDRPPPMMATCETRSFSGQESVNLLDLGGSSHSSGR